MIDKILSAIVGSKFERDLKQYLPLVKKINQLEASTKSLKAEDFLWKTKMFRKRLQDGENLDALLPEAFALVREAAARVIGERIFDTQLIGGIALHQGKIMELKTGEGKTLASVTAAYLNALTGRGVHIATVNSYLAERDAEWMGPVYRYLGLSVGTVLPQMDTAVKKKAYTQDITYGTNNEFGFDYLRDNMAVYKQSMVQRDHYFCIIDEVDSILIDEARTPLIISGQAEDDTSRYYAVNRMITELQECAKDPQTEEYPEEPVGDYKIEEKNKRITFTDQGMNSIEKILTDRGLINESLFIDKNFEYIHYFAQALKAHKLFHLDVDYVVKDGQVQIVDEFTGRILHGRRYSDGLHQAIEAKEGIKIAQRSRTIATITFQNYFRMYNKLAGMTGTADTEAKEFAKIYNLDVVVIPTNRPVIRDDLDDVIYLNEEDKFDAICQEIKTLNEKGQPILVGTVSIEKSERLSKLLTRYGVRHEVLNAKNHAREALIVAEAGAKGSVTIATNMAGRGTDIKLGGNPEFRARKKSGTDASPEKYQEVYKNELAKWQKDYTEIKELGGLHILGTERHEARRIDNQLRGRSGRQGDPGSSRFYISMDDDLMRLFGGENLKSFLSRLGMQPGEPIFHPWINKSIEKAQKRVEERNFEIRKHLLEYDDVLNEQRKYIYQKRNDILNDNELYKRILVTAEEIVSDLFAEYTDKKDSTDYALSSLLVQLKEEFFYVPSLSGEKLLHMGVNELKDFVVNELNEDIKKKQELVGEENFNAFIRFEYLRHIDAKWQEHLESLSALQEAVRLRAYGQKNPLLEYKLEGFQIFDTMLIDIRTNIARKILKVKIRPVSDQRRLGERRRMGNASHRALGQFPGISRTPIRTPVLQKIQVKRTVEKVGRNEPCPCGSGKKYKHCCGR